MHNRLLGCFVLLAGLAGVPAFAAPVDAIRSGDMQRMIPEIVAIYEDAGISWDHGIEWQVGPFTTTFWYYDYFEDVIQTGAVPGAADVDAYWQAWNTTLTDGNFDPAGFFASPEEALELARYNQFVLATHESAHAVTYRYDYDHLRRHDYAINCREYYADRLTVAILNEEAAADPDMKRWRDRYRELVAAMGETIPEQYRHTIPDFATLDADCAVIEVFQPTPDTMQPYASAYFERYRLLLGADLPPLAEIFRTHLEDAHARRHAGLPLAPERDFIELATLADAQEVELGTVHGETTADTEHRSRAAAFGPDGRLWFATLTYDRQSHLASLTFGPEPYTSPPVGAPAGWSHPSNRLEVSSLAVLSPELFLVALEHWDSAGPEGAERHFVTWLAGSQENGAWRLDSLGELEGLQRGAVLRSASNRLFLLSSPDGTVGKVSPNWHGVEVSLEAAAVLGDMPVKSSFRRPIAIDELGRLYEEIGYFLWRSTAPGTAETDDEVLVGNGLVGPRDGVGARAELSQIQLMQWMADGTALILDRGPGYNGFKVRELRPADGGFGNR